VSVTQQLQRGLGELGIGYEGSILERLLRYLDLLQKWNRVYNLTAVREPELMVTHHVLDSLSIVPFVAGAQTLLDVGSGAGLPGIPLAIALPKLAVTLMDSSHKKASFLRQAQLELELANVKVVNQRVETWQAEEKFDVVVSRAFSDLPEFVRLAGHLCQPAGAVLAMKGLYPHEELARIPAGYAVKEVAEITVPALDAHRHLVVVKAA
jgi:16S rRNA (guanine527-N7)-methyltransferase